MQDAATRLRQDAQGLSASQRKAEGGHAGKMQNVNLAGAVLGPSFGLGMDMLSGASWGRDAALAKLHGEDVPFKRSDFKTLQRVTPFGNVPVIQQVINYGQEQIGNIYHWPTPHH